MNFRLSLLPCFLLFLLFSIGACKKEEKQDNIDYRDRDKTLIENYIKANNLTGFTQDSAGVYVSITKPGTGDLPKKGQTIVTKYKGTTLDGQVFDQTKETIIGYPFILGSQDPTKLVIPGWNIAFKKLNKGSQAILLIPSDQAYGTATAANGIITPNSVLRFDVEVVDIR